MISPEFTIWMLLVFGIYLIVLSFIVDVSRNLPSKLLIKVIPFFIGLALILLSVGILTNATN